MTGVDFTPYVSPNSGRRVVMTLSPEDAALTQGKAPWGPVDVTDRTTGTRMRVRSACHGGATHHGAEIVETLAFGETSPAYVD